MKDILEKIYNEEENIFYSILEDLLTTNKKKFIITVNPEIIMKSYKNIEIKEMLLNDMTFLRSTVYNLSNQIYTITHFAANPMPLQERVINYMYFNCQNQILKGIEECAKIFHCSGRHLHRVLGEMEAAGLVKKINRGSYQLLSSPDKVSDK